MATNESVKEMSIKDDLYLSPFQKYILYGFFPWGFLISMSLMLLTTAQILYFVNVNTNYSYQQLLLWNKVFLNKDVEGSDTSMVNTFYVYHYPKLKLYIQESIERYYDINSNTLDNYEYYYESDGEKKPVRMYINYLETKKASDKGYKTEYKLTPKYYGPFQTDTDKEFIDLIDTFTLEFKLIHNVNQNFPTSSTCFTWRITQKYKYTLHGPIRITLDTLREDCGNDSDFYSKPFFFLHLIVGLIALYSLFNIGYSLYKRIDIVSSVNSRASLTMSWENLSTGEKFQFFSVWGAIDLAGNIFQILGSISCMFNDSIYLEIQEKTVGLGCFFGWVGIVQYLKPDPNAYTVGNTIKRSYRTLGPYILGILPIFLAFAFFAMAILWQSGNYNSLVYSMLLQFAMINGDSLDSSVMAAVGASNLFGIIYSFSFLLFFICVIHNIFIAIISESYESLKIRPISNEHEDEDDFQSIGYQQESVAPMILQNLDSRIKKKQSQDFKKLLTAKVKAEAHTNQKTVKVVKKATKLMKKISKNIEKIGKILGDDKNPNVDKKTLKTKAEDLLFINLEEYIEKVLQPSP